MNEIMSPCEICGEKSTTILQDAIEFRSTNGKKGRTPTGNIHYFCDKHKREIKIFKLAGTFNDINFGTFFKEELKMSYNNKEDKLKLLANKTTRSFIEYLMNLQEFKEAADLKDISNIHEIATAMSDKHGRICRHIKHVERRDPRSDWPTDALESIAGYLAYVAMFLNHYWKDNFYDRMESSMLNELEKAIQQHSKKKENQ